MKGLTGYVYKCPYGDFTNGGLSSQAKELTLVGPGIDEIFEATPERPAVKLVTRQFRSGPYMHVEPIDPPPAGHVGWMAGGNFLESTDSRFPGEYPIPIHDRSETAEAYKLLSE